MNDETTPAPARHDRVAVVAALAGTLAVAGAIAVLWRPVAPPLPAFETPLATFDDELLTTIATYRRPRELAAVGALLVGLAVPVLVWLTPVGRRAVTRLAGPRAHASWRAGAVAIAIVAVTSLTYLPVSAWVGLVHEDRWGFRVRGTAGWFRDWVVVVGGRWLLIGAVVVVLAAAVRRWPRSWPYRLTLLATGAAGALLVVHPLILQPLLLPTRPLEAGPVRDALTDVLAAAGDPRLPILVGEASLRTTRVNALVTGLGPTARVVLYDTLLELPTEQVAATVAHELAHHEHADLLRGTLATATAALPLLLLLQMLLRRGTRPSAGAGTRWVRGPTDPRLAAVAVVLIVVVEVVGTPVANVVSRRLESAADHRALLLTEDPGTHIRAVRTFVVRDLAPPRPARWLQVLYGTHPAPADRIRAAVAAAEREDLPLPTLEELEREERAIRHPRAGTGRLNGPAPG